MKIKVRNKLDLLIKDSGIRTYEEMAKRLTENQDYKVGRTTISRLARNENGSFSIEFIEAICNELDCLPGDIFETIISGADQEFVELLQSRLQPFRYGAIHLNRHHQEGKSSSVAAVSTKDEATPSVSKPTKPIANDLDDICGPKVTHLSTDRLKK